MSTHGNIQLRARGHKKGGILIYAMIFSIVLATAIVGMVGVRGTQNKAISLQHVAAENQVDLQSVVNLARAAIIEFVVDPTGDAFARLNAITNENGWGDVVDENIDILANALEWRQDDGDRFFEWKDIDYEPVLFSLEGSFVEESDAPYLVNPILPFGEWERMRFVELGPVDISVTLPRPGFESGDSQAATINWGRRLESKVLELPAANFQLVSFERAFPVNNDNPVYVEGEAIFNHRDIGDVTGDGSGFVRSAASVLIRSDGTIRMGEALTAPIARSTRNFLWGITDMDDLLRIPDENAAPEQSIYLEAQSYMQDRRQLDPVASDETRLGVFDFIDWPATYESVVASGEDTNLTFRIQLGRSSEGISEPLPGVFLEKTDLAGTPVYTIEINLADYEPDNEDVTQLIIFETGTEALAPAPLLNVRIVGSETSEIADHPVLIATEENFREGDITLQGDNSRAAIIATNLNPLLRYDSTISADSDNIHEWRGYLAIPKTLDSADLPITNAFRIAVDSVGLTNFNIVGTLMINGNGIDHPFTDVDTEGTSNGTGRFAISRDDTETFTPVHELFTRPDILLADRLSFLMVSVLNPIIADIERNAEAAASSVDDD